MLPAEAGPCSWSGVKAADRLGSPGGTGPASTPVRASCRVPSCLWVAAAAAPDASARPPSCPCRTTAAWTRARRGGEGRTLGLEPKWLYGWREREREKERERERERESERGASSDECVEL